MIFIVIGHSLLAVLVTVSWVFKNADWPSDATGWVSLIYFVTAMVGWLVYVTGWHTAVYWLACLLIVVYHTLHFVSERRYSQ